MNMSKSEENCAENFSSISLSKALILLFKSIIALGLLNFLLKSSCISSSRAFFLTAKLPIVFLYVSTIPALSLENLSISRFHCTLSDDFATTRHLPSEDIFPCFFNSRKVSSIIIVLPQPQPAATSALFLSMQNLIISS